MRSKCQQRYSVEHQSYVPLDAPHVKHTRNPEAVSEFETKGGVGPPSCTMPRRIVSEEARRSLPGFFISDPWETR